MIKMKLFACLLAVSMLFCASASAMRQADWRKIANTKHAEIYIDVANVYKNKEGINVIRRSDVDADRGHALDIMTNKFGVRRVYEHEVYDTKKKMVALKDTVWTDINGKYLTGVANNEKFKPIEEKTIGEAVLRWIDAVKRQGMLYVVEENKL